IRQIQRELGITTIFVTHDQEEALSMSDRVVVMNGGVAEQVAEPFEIYNRPATRFVAGFVGQLSRIEARVVDPASGEVEIAGARHRLNRPLPAGSVALALRPEVLRLGADPSRELTLTGRVAEVDFLGSVIRLRVDVGHERLSADLFNRPDTPPPAVGSTVTLSAAAADLIVLSA
ncbi:MAG: TOBE domain-containing protein, partial [Rhodobacterales bacterium]|nr:TOBE domain-containing protein [Rhodobacterales bacterium]MDX5500491.1 TOBE domain-containing protein [Rhodobacterales bacterium]